MKIKPNHPIKLITMNSLSWLPTPSSISYMWNWGSLMGMTLMTQLVTGFLLSSHYMSDTSKAFDSVIHVTRDINYGFELRFIHMNAASFFFIFIFIHVSRGILFSSFKYKHTWVSGVVIILILMATAFLGYVLPWGQMSFWGATVITNLVSAVPYLGKEIVEWLWGGFSIGNATLSRFFSLHFILPFSLVAMVVFHLASLHMTGSNKPSGSNPNSDKIPFHPFFSVKDILPITVFFVVIVLISFLNPFSMGDPENFNVANPLNTPIHIQPEWYFLFAYAILRSIPNKLGGVVALVSSIVILVVLPLLKKTKMSKKWLPPMKMTFWWFSLVFVILSWIGASPVETPYENIGKMFSLIYFITLTSN